MTYITYIHRHEDKHTLAAVTVTGTVTGTVTV